MVAQLAVDVDGDRGGRSVIVLATVNGGNGNGGGNRTSKVKMDTPLKKFTPLLSQYVFTSHCYVVAMCTSYICKCTLLP